MPDASRTTYLNRLYFSVSLQPLPSSSATHLSSHPPRDVLQVGLCIQRNCYTASNTCTSSRRQSLQLFARPIPESENNVQKKQRRKEIRHEDRCSGKQGRLDNDGLNSLVDQRWLFSFLT